MNKVLLGLLLAALNTSKLPAHDGPGIGIEDLAPPLQVGQWLQGKPVSQFQPDQVYVIAFWATWSAPARAALPSLDQIARQFENQATVLAISIFESEQEEHATRTKKITELIQQLGEHTKVAVADDVPRFAMAQNWMWAADEYELPTVFVIDREQRIAWIGTVTNNLPGVVSNVVAGTHDRKAAHEELHANRALRKQEQDELSRLSDLWRQKKYNEALSAIAMLSARKPEYRSGLISFRFNLLLEADAAAAYRYAKELAAAEYKDNANNLDGMARAICQTPGLQQPDYTLALQLAQQACALNTNRNPRHLSTVAEVHFRTGHLEQAIADITTALELSRQQPNTRPIQESLEMRLQQFIAAKKKLADETALANP